VLHHPLPRNFSVARSSPPAQVEGLPSAHPASQEALASSGSAKPGDARTDAGTAAGIADPEDRSSQGPFAIHVRRLRPGAGVGPASGTGSVPASGAGGTQGRSARTDVRLPGDEAVE